MTWLTEWDLDVDINGNAVLIWQDIRNNGVNNVVIYKISLQGQFMWGADGIALSSDTNPEYSNMSPIVFCASNGSVYAAWMRTTDKNQVWIQCLDAAGNKLWGADGISLNSPDLSYTWPQIIQADNDNILLKYYIDSGPFWSPTRHLYVAKYDSSGFQLWNSPINVAGGMTAWQQEIPFIGDGANGAVLAWYDDRDQNNVSESYVQRVDSNGEISMAPNGSIISTNMNSHQFYPILSVDPGNEHVYIYWKESSLSQNQTGTFRQLMDFEGNRLWSDSGIPIQPVSYASGAPVFAGQNSLGSVCIYSYGSTDQTLELFAACYDASGSVWTVEIQNLATNPSNKYHYSGAMHPDGWSVITWEQGLSAMDVYAMRMNPDGSLGMQYPAPWGLTAEFIPPYTIELAWQHPSQYFLPVEYEVFVNNEMYIAIDGEQNFCTLEMESTGTYLLKVRARYEGDFYSEFSETVLVTVVSSDDHLAPAANLQLRVFPNPISRQGRLKLDGVKSPGNATLTIYNLRGQHVYQKKTLLKAGQNELSLDEQILKALPSGIYQMRIKTLEGDFNRKFGVVK